MSHFTVLVIGESPEEQLAPFQENNMGDCPMEYMEFNETESENLQKYLTETCERVVMPDGRLLSKFDDEFRVEGSMGIGTSTHSVPENLEIRNFPFVEIYPTFEDFMSQYHGYEERDKIKGLYGFWFNPNSKWDWYQLGGRWTGFFKLKEGEDSGVVGSPGILTECADEGYADSAMKKDIDFESMRNSKVIRATEEYDLAQIIIGHLERNLTWEEVKEKFGEEANHGEVRDFYWSQPRCAVWREKSRANSDDFPFSWSSSPDDYLVSREEFIENARKSAGTTFAVVMNGKWYEKGEMGWWGMVSNQTCSEYDWTNYVYELLESLPDDTLLSVFDCHI